MDKFLRTIIVTLVLLIAGVAVFVPSAFALGESMDLHVTTVIDNASEYPVECANLSSKYSVVRIYRMGYSPQYANRPIASCSKVFNIVNNQTTNVHYSNYSGATCDTVWFETNSYTDQHLSLYSLEYTDADNLTKYTYSPSGSPSDPFSTDPFNWAEVIDSSQRSASVTLHFRYNPDIESVSAPEPDPEPDYNKTIDYLGDGVPNPDTNVDGTNDYRLYLDVTTQSAAEDNKADIIFVLDVSGSMSYDLESGQTKISVLKSTMINAINNLTQNSYNRISIIKFATNSQILISSSTDKNQLISCIQGLTAVGCTNYYQSLTDAISEVNTMSGSDTENREKVIFFITDGEPTIAAPAAVSSSMNDYAGLIYACTAARQISNVDRFYSIFIGDNRGSASTLQTITQMVNVGKERYMVQASSAQQVSNTFQRFMSKMSNSIYNVAIFDELSPYVSYTGGLKVTRATGGNEPVTLFAGLDYSISAGSNGLGIQLSEATTPDTKYTMSFNVRSSDEALDYYDLNQSYPNVGDAATDYPGNATSSGQPGFYSNAAAALSYSFGGSGSAEKAYHHPVVQVVEPEPVPVEIQVRKILNDKDLRAGMFSFELRQVTDQGDVLTDTVTNDAEGFVTFDSLDLEKPGTYNYKIKEVIPSSPEPGITYDTKTIQVTVNVTRSNDDLVAQVEYPDEAVFINFYEPQPVDVTLKAKKELEGRALSAGMFDFSLLDGNGDLVDMASNTASGLVEFSPVTFTRAGVYRYTIKESIPGQCNPNIRYDYTIVQARITVTDEDGILSADVQYTPEAATFHNEYVYPESSATIEVTKVLTGMQLTAGMFEFELDGDDIDEPITKTNQADGKIKYNLTFTSPGEHTFTIKEIVPSTVSDEYIEYMNYDTKTITVHVEVADDGSGELNTTVTYEPDEFFYNSYQLRGGIW